MTDPATDQLERILRLCAEAAPRPWYPRVYAEAAGVPRDALDAPLERLRLRGLIRLTEWQAGNGQGYVLTPEGEHVLRNPRLLAQVRSGHVPQGPTPEGPRGPRPRWNMTTYDRGESIREALLGRSRPVVTFTLIALNVLVFLAAIVLAQRQKPPVRVEDVLMGSSPPVQVILHQLGAVRGEDILRGQWWRVLACCFVHFGLLHIGVNMYSLYVIGPLLERMWGPVRFLVLYLIAGLAGSCIALIFMPHGLLAGASGALWGVMTSMAVWVWLNRAFLPRPLVSTWLRQLLIVFVLNVGISFVPGISKEAHFGGGAIGAVAAVLLTWQRFGSFPLRWASVAALVALPLLCLGALAEAPRFNGQWAHLEFDGYYLPRAGRLEQQAVDEVRKANVEELLQKHPKRRDAGDVQRAVTALQEARDRLVEASNLLSGAGPFRDPNVLESRQALVEYFQARARLYEVDAEILKAGVTADNPERLEQQQRFLKALEHYRELRQKEEG